MNRLLFLKSIAPFRHLSFDELLALDKVIVKAEYLQGETIIAEGTCGTDLYLIYSGTVAIKQPSAQHGQHPDLTAGQYFSEIALFDTVPSSITAAAKTDCVLFMLNKDQFRSLALKSPDMLFEFCKVLGHRALQTPQPGAAG